MIAQFLDSIGRNSKNTRRMYNSGLNHFSTMLDRSNRAINTIVSQIKSNQVNQYELLDQYISYLSSQPDISQATFKPYIAAVKSFLEFYDIDIVPSKFKRRVKMPKVYPDAEQPLEINEIREMLVQCKNERLKCFLLLLLSSGTRAIEACSLRLCDINFQTNPTKIHVRKEYSKTKRPRDIYISNEATKHLQSMLEFRKNELKDDTLIFSVKLKAQNPRTMYQKMLLQFEYLLMKVHKDQKKDNGKRNKITLHSFRRTCYSIIEAQVGNEYANWFLGHNHSVYWTHKDNEKAEIYRTKCMNALTILDYTAIDTRSKNIEIAMKERDQEIAILNRSVKELQVLLQEPEKFIRMRDEAYAMGREYEKRNKKIN